MALYGHAVLMILIGLELSALAYNDFGYTPATRVAVMVLVLVLGSFAMFLLQTLFWAVADGRSTVSAVMGLQLGSSALTVLSLFALYVDAWLLIVIAIIFLCSFGDLDPRPLVVIWRRSRSLRV
jgi:low temperature requirement protein LtrA